MIDLEWDFLMISSLLRNSEVLTHDYSLIPRADRLPPSLSSDLQEVLGLELILELIAR